MCSRLPTVDLVVCYLRKNIFYFTNSQFYSWLTTAQAPSLISWRHFWYVISLWVEKETVNKILTYAKAYFEFQTIISSFLNYLKQTIKKQNNHNLISKICVHFSREILEKNLNWICTHFLHNTHCAFPRSLKIKIREINLPRSGT